MKPNVTIKGNPKGDTYLPPPVPITVKGDQNAR